MSNDIYDILNNLSKSTPVSTVEAEPIYESVDPRGDIMEAIGTLEAKFDKFNPNDEAEDKYLNPQAKRFVQLAKAKFPETSSDLEAVVAAIGDKTEELDTRDQETAEWMNKAKATIGQQQKEIEQTEQAVNDANARYDAQEKRFQDFNRQVAAAELDVKQQAQAALDYAKQPEAKPQDIISKTQATTPKQASAPATTQPKNVVQFPTTTAASEPTAAAPTPEPAQERPPAVEVPGQKQSPSDELAARRTKKQAAAAAKKATSTSDLDQWLATGTEGLQEQVRYPVGSRALGQLNWELIKRAYSQRKPELDLFFGDKAVHFDASEIYATVAWFYKKTKKNHELVPNLAGLNLSDVRSTENLKMSTAFALHQQAWNTMKRRMELKRVRAPVAPLDFNAPKPEVAPQQQQPATVKPVVQPKQGQLDLFNENNNMKTTKPLEESLMEKYMGFKKTVAAIKKGGSAEDPEAVAAAIGRKKYGKKAFQKAAATGKKLGEAAKPDFLDLDKDGDTDEPMKSAAKTAKDHEPAEVDSDAVAKRKRLQALKDKQEDERAEKGDDDKSSSRFVKGRAYGGSAQKDDKEDDDLDESGLQAYLGKKKYGKEGMKALQQAGREGASKEKMAVLRAKHDKMDEARPSRADKVTKDLTSIADKKGYKSAKDFTRQDWDKVAKPHGYTGKEIAAVRGHKVEEVAPPGAKAERMVKYIKKGYAKDGKLTPKEKGIAYATAWKARNKGQVEEATEFGDTVKNSKAELKKHKMVKEGRNAESSEYTYETVGRILSDEQPGLDCNSEAFVKAVYDELIELKMTPKAARWLVHYDEDFISDTASAYSHFCDSKAKEAMECGAPMNSFVSEEPLLDAEHELAEIAKLAGLAREDFNPMVPGDSASPLTYAGCSKCNADPCCCEDVKAMDEGMGCSEDELNEAATRKDFRMVADLLKSIPDMAKRTELAMYHADIFKQQNTRFKKEMFLAAAGVDTTPIKDAKDEVLVSEEEMGEGNEFSGALAAAKASGAKEFEVDGKKYTVKEDININVTANGEEDVVNLIRKLSGMPVVAIQAQPAEQSCGTCGSAPCGCESLEEDSPKERDVEYTNTPREEVAGTDAAIPSGTDLHRAKKAYSDKPFRGDNPMAVAEAKEERLWTAYEEMINDLKA